MLVVATELIDPIRPAAEPGAVGGRGKLEVTGTAVAPVLLLLADVMILELLPPAPGTSSSLGLFRLSVESMRNRSSAYPNLNKSAAERSLPLVSLSVLVRNSDRYCRYSL